VRRALATLGGLALGLFTAWLCAHLLSHADLPRHGAGTGCLDDEHCDASAWSTILTLIGVLVPILGCAVAGYLASSRGWAGKKTSVILGLLVVANMLLVSARFLV
jgi:hypothetical protein